MATPVPVVKNDVQSVKRKPSRVKEVLGVLVIIAIIVSIAFYQEQIGYFFGMHLWDKTAPGKTVTEFLTAGEKGDRKAADSYLGSADFHPLTKAGKWEGYFIATPAGKLEFTFAELAPKTPPQAIPTEFLFQGKGAAEVKVPDARGKAVKYRLEMQNGWKVTEILGGHASK